MSPLSKASIVHYRHFPVSSATPGAGEEGSNIPWKAPFHLRPKLDSTTGGFFGGHLGGNVVRKGFRNEVEKGSNTRLKRRAFEKHGKELLEYMLTII